jgi:Ca2+-binding RTX toxin-like protein
MALIVGFTGNNPLLQGTPDADEIFGNSTGTIAEVAGNDRIFGLAGDDEIVGDGRVIALGGRGGNDVIQGGDGEDEIYGDARAELYGVGGNDVIYGNADDDSMYGDAETLQPGARGGNDKIFGGCVLVGETYDTMFDAIGGNDLLDARSATCDCFIYGETYDDTMKGYSVGGRDVLKGSAFGDEMHGEGVNLLDATKGGDDRLAGYGGDDTLYGEGYTLSETTIAGDDLLRGGAGDDEIYGDASELSDFARGGDDVIYSGGGEDEIWGDGELEDDATGGADDFHFGPGFGDDTIFDFRQEDGDQLIFRNLSQSEVTISIVGGDTVITTLGDESVTLVGYTDGLTVGSDIVFA